MRLGCTDCNDCAVDESGPETWNASLPGFDARAEVMSCLCAGFGASFCDSDSKTRLARRLCSGILNAVRCVARKPPGEKETGGRRANRTVHKPFQASTRLLYCLPRVASHAVGFFMRRSSRPAASGSDPLPGCVWTAFAQVIDSPDGRALV